MTIQGYTYNVGPQPIEIVTAKVKIDIDDDLEVIAVGEHQVTIEVEPT